MCVTDSSYVDLLQIFQVKRKHVSKPFWLALSSIKYSWFQHTVILLYLCDLECDGANRRTKMPIYIARGQNQIFWRQLKQGVGSICSLCCYLLSLPLLYSEVIIVFEVFSDLVLNVNNRSRPWSIERRKCGLQLLLVETTAVTMIMLHLVQIQVM